MPWAERALVYLSVLGWGIGQEWGTPSLYSVQGLIAQDSGMLIMGSGKEVSSGGLSGCTHCKRLGPGHGTVLLTAVAWWWFHRVMAVRGSLNRSRGGVWVLVLLYFWPPSLPSTR